MSDEWFFRLRFGQYLAYAATFAWSFLRPGISPAVWIVLAILAFGVFSNRWLHQECGSKLIGLAIVADITLLTAVLWLFGGASNPFSMLFLIQVVVASIFASTGWAWVIYGLSTLGFRLLFLVSAPLDHHPASDAAPIGFSLHVEGMFVVFLLSGALVTLCITKMRRELEERARKIEDLNRRVTAEERAAALAAITAQAAHELADPLATISLICEGLRVELKGSKLSAEVEALESEVSRSAAILGAMRSSGAELAGEGLSAFSVKELVEQLKSALAEDERGKVKFKVVDGQIYGVRQTLAKSLIALLHNAIEAGSAEGVPVTLQIEVIEGVLITTIVDHGSGITRSNLERTCEPFFSTKGGSHLGLGVYLARRFALTFGGSLDINSTVGVGTTVIMSIPSRFSNDA